MNRRYLGMGLPTLVMVFASLALTSFSTVAYLQANSALSRAKAYEDKTTEYYEAENKAVVMIEEIRNGLHQEYLMNDGSYEFVIAINEKSYLAVRIELSEEEIIVRRWQMVSGVNEEYGDVKFDV